MRIGLIILACCVLILIIFIVVINFNYRVAYFLYKIPKIHWVVSFFIFRNKDFLKETIFVIPHSIMPIIDDLGWMGGSDLRINGGPSRLITTRDPTIEDYHNIAIIAKKAGVRIPGMMIISDFDQQNICSRPEYNSPVRASNLTEQGVYWNNKNSMYYARQIMNCLKENSQYIELGLHGVRHEHFTRTGFQNAEWANGDSGESWGKENTILHCEVFKDILRQYFSESECQFPNSFVPPSHAFAFNSEDAKILHGYGIKYMCSSCAFRPSMKFLQNTGTFHDGILMLDRTELSGINKQAHIPKRLTKNAWIGTHFPNYWGRSVKKWIRFLRSINKNTSTMLGRNTEDNNSQWIYNHYISGRFKGGEIQLNNLYMPQWAYENGLINGIWLKTHLHCGQHISEINIPGLNMAAYYEDEYENAYVYLIDNALDNGALDRKIYKGEYRLGKVFPLCTYVDIGKETYLLKGIMDDGQGVITVKVKIYGKHTLKICTSRKINGVHCINSALQAIECFNQEIKLSVKTKNMLGEDLELVIFYR